MTVTSEPRGPLPPVPGGLKIQSFWNTQDKKWSFAFHLLKAIASAWSGADIAHVLTEFASSVTTNILPRYGAYTQNLSNVATDLTSNMGLMVPDTGVGAGTRMETDPQPISCALRCTYTAALRARGGHPGQFFGGLDANDRDPASAAMWTTATRTAWISAIGNLVSDLTALSLPSGSSCNPVYISYFSNGAFRTPPLAIAITPTGVEVQQRICSRRRRLGKGVPGE